MATGCCLLLSICRTAAVCRWLPCCVQWWRVPIRLARCRLCSMVALRVALLLRCVATFVLLLLLARVASPWLRALPSSLPGVSVGVSLVTLSRAVKYRHLAGVLRFPHIHSNGQLFAMSMMMLPTYSATCGTTALPNPLSLSNRLGNPSAIPPIAG